MGECREGCMNVCPALMCPSDGMYLQGSVTVDKQGQFHLSVFILANTC